ncbi:hypothetical protein MHM83_15225 [Tenacibaculum sp. Mcav3-52]|uniref:hypothetical protein n=1 Tax=Tenacibaculum sp. Mcav3-52 TaxID=2917762 RepID=UPI001EF19E05|nr:hypothetical protein [Tenacibaculum sp. Mcav3-52]MCG7503218.1 hypothetical protein [Tenacibaculum sp. Mcav3-52]
MKTILDNCKTLFLDELHYNKSLQLIVSERILLNENQSIKIGEGTIDNVKPIVITENSKKFKIEFDFDDIINFQVID